MNKTLLIVGVFLLIGQLRADNKPYDENANQAALESKIRIYREDLRRLREAANQIKRTITNNRANTTLGISTLTEGMALERDILFNIESYLTLPFGVSKCDCYSFSDAEKNRLNKDIQNIKESLNSLNRVTSGVPQCDQIQPIKGEVRRQLQYIKTVEENLNAPCCGTHESKKRPNQQATGLTDVSRYTFQTNIKANNWIYGGLTRSELRLRYFSWSASRNVINCPLSTPFFNGKGCINCEGEYPYWDMAKERCAQCAKYYTFNEKNRDCVQSTFYESKEVNVTVPPISQREVTQVVQPIFGKKIVEKIVTKRSSKRTTTKSSSQSGNSWSSGSSSFETAGSGSAGSSGSQHNEAESTLNNLF